jgi:hypothetical protein
LSHRRRCVTDTPRPPLDARALVVCPTYAAPFFRTTARRGRCEEHLGTHPYCYTAFD